MKTKSLDSPRVRVISPVGKEKVYEGKNLLKSQVWSSKWNNERAREDVWLAMFGPTGLLRSYFLLGSRRFMSRLDISWGSGVSSRWGMLSLTAART